jgi:RNA-directed DNA polymerase
MLMALESGVRGGKWFSLIDKVYAMDNLRAAAAQVIANRGAAGVDNVSIEKFKRHREHRLENASRWLREDRYRPLAVKRVWIPKPGGSEKRPLGIPTVVDRVVQTALRNAIEPIFERDFAKHSYGFRPGRGCRDALRRVDALLRQGNMVVVDADIKGYFDSIPHERLMELVEEKISDGRVLKLIRSYLEQEVMETSKCWTPAEGTPQGGVISPLLANIYLDPLDHLMAEKGFEMVRYADDFIILCRTHEEAEEALRIVQNWTEEVGLRLHPDKTKLVTWEEGFDFLGYRFQNGKRWLAKKSKTRFRSMVRAKTRRTSGQSLLEIVVTLNLSLRGWFEYFKYLSKPMFRELDGFIRRRLRSILRTRLKRGNSRRYAKGNDNVRWPNAFFHDLGLFSLERAWGCAHQSISVVNHQLESRVREIRMHGSEGGATGTQIC